MNWELMLLNGKAVATVDSLNTWFPIERLEGDCIVVRDVPGRHISRLGASLMTRGPIQSTQENFYNQCLT